MFCLKVFVLTRMYGKKSFLDFSSHGLLLRTPWSGCSTRSLVEKSLIFSVQPFSGKAKAVRRARSEPFVVMLPLCQLK